MYSSARGAVTDRKSSHSRDARLPHGRKHFRRIARMSAFFTICRPVSKRVNRTILVTRRASPPSVYPSRHPGGLGDANSVQDIPITRRCGSIYFVRDFLVGYRRLPPSIMNGYRSVLAPDLDAESWRVDVRGLHKQIRTGLNQTRVVSLLRTGPD